MESLAKFTPPADIGDFDQNPSLKDDWDTRMSNFFEQAFELLKDTEDGEGVPENQICLFDPRKQPLGQLQAVPITWGGFPSVMNALHPNQDEAFRLADKLATFGIQDDLNDPITANYFSGPNRTFNNILPLKYRQQDEYLEWAIRKDDATGKIKEILFTCEGPEYWGVLSKDKQLLLKLYQKYASQEVVLSDLLFQDDTFGLDLETGEDNKNVKGKYNPYNKWNLSNAIHLTHPANNLFAEVILAAQGTVLRGSTATPLSDAQELICCARYGEPNRNSDPTIGAGANSGARNRNWVTLRNPIGLYISDIDSSQFTKPDNSPIPDFQQRYWNVLRASADGSLILRASLKVPDGETFNGKELLLGDLLVNGKPLQHGGQAANAITMSLYAAVVAGGPTASPKPCKFKCCPDPDHPDFEIITKIRDKCPTSSLEMTAARAAISKEAKPPKKVIPYAILRSPF